MQSRVWTVSSIKSHQLALKQQICELVPLKESTLKEAIARGLGFRTEAALKAWLKETPHLPDKAFSDHDFVVRVGELTDGSLAEVIAEILAGVKLNISVTKVPEEFQGRHRYTDVAYSVEVSLEGIDAELLKNDIFFHLPEFGTTLENEPYRVDSASSRRAASDYRKTRFQQGHSSVVAKLVAGRWHGSFFVYSLEHQTDDTRCIKALKAALAKAILSQIPTQVRCSIFKPDGYEPGAWRIEMRLPTIKGVEWEDSKFPFEIPDLPKRHFHMKSGFGYGTEIGCFVDGVWSAHVYSNGIEESQNPTSIAAVKQALLLNVTQALKRFHGDEGASNTLVFDASNAWIGTVQRRGDQYHASIRTRTLERPGNSHTLLGSFKNLHDARSAILDSKRPRNI